MNPTAIYTVNFTDPVQVFFSHIMVAPPLAVVMYAFTCGCCCNIVLVIFFSTAWLFLEWLPLPWIMHPVSVPLLLSIVMNSDIRLAALSLNSPCRSISSQLCFLAMFFQVLNCFFDTPAAW